MEFKIFCEKINFIINLICKSPVRIQLVSKRCSAWLGKCPAWLASARKNLARIHHQYLLTQFLIDKTSIFVLNQRVSSIFHHRLLRYDNSHFYCFLFADHSTINICHLFRAVTSHLGRLHLDNSCKSEFTWCAKPKIALSFCGLLLGHSIKEYPDVHI